MNNSYSYHDKFLLYLESLHKYDEEKSIERIEFAEEQLPAFLRSNGYHDASEIYDYMEEDFWKGVVTDGLPNSTDADRDYAYNIMMSIRLFKEFINFNKTADYKKLFRKKLKKESKKANTTKRGGEATNIVDNTLPPEDEKRKEGAVTQVSVTHYERNADDRRKVLERDNYECQVCHMKFINTYGEIGKDFIEVHHLYPVCNMGEDYQFDPMDKEKGLVCLCSNCHSMIHRGGHYEVFDGERKMVPMTLQELIDLYKQNNP